MALRFCWLFLLVACCGVSKASDDEVEVCRGHCHTTAIVLIPDLYDNSTDPVEASERKRGDNRVVSPQSASSRDLLLLDIHDFCTILCQRMKEDEVMLDLCASDQEYNDGSEEESEEEDEQEDRLRRRKAARARKPAAARRGTGRAARHKLARAAHRRHAN